MRPTDENQHASTRPNLMSSGTRRASGEENILAMLERNERGRLATAPRLAWYMSAGVLVLVLITALAWLLHENQANNEALRVVEQSAVVAVPDPPLGAAVAATTADAVPAQAATIVDVPEPAPLPAAAALVLTQAARTEPPPLVLLSPSEAVSARAPAPRPQAVREAPPTRELAVEHAAPAPRPAAARPKPASGARVAAKAPARPAQPGRARKAQGAAGRTADAAVDTDVALISAIISQSVRHTDGAPCGNDRKCPAAPAAQP
ncbi:MAG: hypothetical protein ACJ8LG_17485 [Massilia sp.]